MLKQRFFFLSFCLAMIISCAAAFSANAQEQTITPDLSVVGIKLGTRAAAKDFIKNFQARISEDGRPMYFYYNKFANQVMKLTAASFDDRYLITEIEVYKVGKNYTAPHFQAENIGYFKTEKDIFIGYKQSTASMITGIPNIDGKDMTGPKTVAKKIGAPTEDLKTEDRETLIYKLPEVEIADENGKTAKYSYSAQYEFNENKLKRFILKISPKE